MKQPLQVADLFCGAGGSSTGLAQACEDLDVEYSLTAVNHWDVAIATHSANHPNVKHLCAEVDKLKARALSEYGYLDIMWSSPACTEHSYAKGGHSVDDQKRHSAWAIVRETERYRPKIHIVENVPPFRNWGPTEPVFHRNGKPNLDKKGNQVLRPIKARKGETYRAWFAAMESLGYTGRADLINAADHGEPQSRIRLFVVFTVPGIDFVWPERTYGAPGSLEVVAGLRKQWRGAREILDRTLPTRSIFERPDDPLSENTLRRITIGADRFWGEPYLVILRRHADARGLDLPIPTIAAGGQHMALADVALRPLICGNASQAVPRPDEQPGPTVTAQGGRAMHFYEPELRPIVGANRTHNVPVSDAEPAPTVTTATGGGAYVAEPTAIVLGQHGGGVARSEEQPMSTIATDGYVRVFEPVLIDVRHGDRPHQPKSEEEPLNTVTAKNGVGVGEAVIVSYAERDGKGSGKNPATPKTEGDPLGTVITRDRFGVAEPVIVNLKGQSTVRDSNLPAPTVTAQVRHLAIAEPFLVSYHGESKTGGMHRPRTMSDPINTVDTNNRLALCEPSVEVLDSLPDDAPKDRIFQGSDGNLYLLDIRFRMLQPFELARAQGFPDDYKFTGTKSDQTAQIGNAVPVAVAKALLRQAIIALRGGDLEAAA